MEGDPILMQMELLERLMYVLYIIRAAEINDLIPIVVYYP